jgi:hypothetical protein
MRGPVERLLVLFSFLGDYSDLILVAIRFSIYARADLSFFLRLKEKVRLVLVKFPAEILECEHFLTFIILGWTEETWRFYSDRFVYVFDLLNYVFFLETLYKLALIFRKRLSPEDKCVYAATANPALLARLR